MLPWILFILLSKTKYMYQIVIITSTEIHYCHEFTDYYLTTTIAMCKLLPCYSTITLLPWFSGSLQINVDLFLTCKGVSSEKGTKVAKLHASCWSAPLEKWVEYWEIFSSSVLLNISIWPSWYNFRTHWEATVSDVMPFKFCSKPRSYSWHERGKIRRPIICVGKTLAFWQLNSMKAEEARKSYL